MYVQFINLLATTISFAYLSFVQANESNKIRPMHTFEEFALNNETEADIVESEFTVN